MLTKLIEYKDYMDKPRKKTAYFNLSEAELVEMEMSKNGGFSKILERIIEAEDQEQLSKFFKDIITKSYGVVSPDGEYFDKSPAVVEKFLQSKAYSKLYIELISDAEALASFINAMMPKEYITNVAIEGQGETVMEQ